MLQLLISIVMLIPLCQVFLMKLHQMQVRRFKPYCWIELLFYAMTYSNNIFVCAHSSPVEAEIMNSFVVMKVLHFSVCISHLTWWYFKTSFYVSIVFSAYHSSSSEAGPSVSHVNMEISSSSLTSSTSPAETDVRQPSWYSSIMHDYFLENHFMSRT